MKKKLKNEELKKIYHKIIKQKKSEKSETLNGNRNNSENFFTWYFVSII